MTTMYELAREAYAKQGIDTEAVIETLANKAISMHWTGEHGNAACAGGEFVQICILATASNDVMEV